MSEFRHSLKVYYEDTDAGGIVYYANYLKYAERGRTEALRELGFDNIGLRDTDGLLIVVRKVDIDYLTSAFLEDELTVVTEITDVKGTSFWMQQTVQKQDGTVCAHAKILLVCVDVHNGRPFKIPPHLREAFEAHKMILH